MSVWAAPGSFDEYIARRHAALLRFAHVLCGDPHTAADLVQDAFVRAGLAWPRITRTEDPEAYLRRTIINLNLSRWRRFRRERAVAEPPETGFSDPEPWDDAIWAALATLPRQQRTVLVLRFYQDMSMVTIADLLGCSVGTVKSNSSRALDKLRAILDSPAAAATSAKEAGA